MEIHGFKADLPIPESQAITMIVTNTTPLLRFILMLSEFPFVANLYNQARVVKNQIKDASLSPFFEGKLKGRKTSATPTTEGVIIDESINVCYQPLRPPNKPSNSPSDLHQFPLQPSMPYSTIPPSSGYVRPSPKRSYYPTLPESHGDIFFALISCNAIQLPPQKEGVHPRADTSKYCPYHRAPSHEIHNCFTFRNWVYDMSYQGRINWDDIKVHEKGPGYCAEPPPQPPQQQLILLQVPGNGTNIFCKGSVDTTISGVDTMVQSKGRNVKKRSSSVDTSPRQVDTESSQVDTRDLSQRFDLPVWESVSTHLMGKSTHSGISVT
ncbi:hypothetical protein Taro_025864 [Colocasia esculenta]|uniref:Uncharacterized protein n=1 Tax=Colocasia esculenta TaxID=4460 RepID=A0A843VHT6_COLES|nr:hypothetical protein [Colocasia esculenta]